VSLKNFHPKKELNAFLPLTSQTRQGYLHHCCSTQSCKASHFQKAREEIRGVHIGKEGVRPSSFTDN
jgi:hypothetical protein